MKKKRQVNIGKNVIYDIKGILSLNRAVKLK
jgi:hypothetical protein